VPVAALLREAAGVSRTVDLEDVWIPIADGPRQSAAGSGELRLTRTNRGIYATGDFHAVIAEQCARCLRDVALPVEISLEEEILPSVDPVTGATVLSDEPDVARLTDASEIDLGTMLAEGLSLVEPIAPLCRPDCPGLCPVCGGDLIGDPHDHPDNTGDPRLAALRGLRVDDDAETG
jgi:uncharacterized protein